MGEISSVIIGTGSYIPKVRVPKSHFLNHDFFNDARPTEEVVDDLERISGISERRYVRPDQSISDISLLAAEDALRSSKIDPESLDYIIVGRNSGEVITKSSSYDLIPSFASKMKNVLKIKDPKVVAYDLIFSSVKDLESVCGNGSSANLDCSNKWRLKYGNSRLVTSNVAEEEGISCVASDVKEKLGLKGSGAAAYDVVFGCPGWLHGVGLADEHIRSGGAKRVLVIGADIISRLVDSYNRDCMIFADGAGAAIFEGVKTGEPVGVLSYVARSDTNKEVYFLRMGTSCNHGYDGDGLFVDMLGQSIFGYALQKVPGVIKECLDVAGLSFDDVKRLSMHQANYKLDYRTARKLCKLHGLRDEGEIKKKITEIMPMTIRLLANPSAATVPTMVDLLRKGDPGGFINKSYKKAWVESRGLGKGYLLNSGEVDLWVSVGAGMACNALAYREP